MELEIKDVASSWKNLGIQLSIDHARLTQIGKENLGKTPPDECFQSVLQWWLDNAGESSRIWKVITQNL